MQEITIALEILSSVLDEKVPFADALKKKFQSNVAIRPMRADVAALVGCELRHHLMFQFVTKDLPLSEEHKRLVSLGLANIAFFHRFDEAKVGEDIQKGLGENYPLYEDLAKMAKKPESLIPENISRSSNQYLSLRYNAPEWTLKIFEHFGFGNTYKILRKVSRPASPSLRVRKSAAKIEEIVASPEFSYSSTPDMVDYHGKTSLRKNKLVRDGAMFEEKPFAHQLLLDHKVSAPQQVLLYNGNASSALERDLIEMYGSEIGLNIAVDDTDSRPEVLRLIRELGLRNVNFFSAPAGETMASAVSTAQELVIVAPDSTNFDDIPSSPDFLLRFNHQKMDTLIRNETKALNNASEFVEVGGKLIYVVFTISKKEGHLTIAEFLRTHDKFSLVEEKQYFPYEKEGVAAYVAILTRGEKPLTVNTPLVDLTEAEIAATFGGATASSK